jgi:ribonuclease HI
MPGFQCSVCGATFQVPQAAVDKYPGWQPKYCREHSPKAPASASRSPRPPTTSGGVNRGKSLREENLTVAEVLAKYHDGPDSGVFTDGSAVPNPGPGGWGVVWVEDGTIRSENHGHHANTTNNRMELRALIAAFTMLPEDAVTSVQTDSRLCVDTITKWAPGWERRGWKKKSGPIKNLELVQELLALYRAHPTCKLIWIAAHSGNRWNEYADSLATAWMRAAL